jgi:hypothetical protein
MLDQCEQHARGARKWAWDQLGGLAKRDRDPWLRTIIDGRRKLKAGEQVEAVLELAAPTIVAEIREHNMEPGKSLSKLDLDELRAAETLNDAHLVLLHMHSVRQWRVEGNLDNAVMEAIRLGRIVEQLRVRPVEPLATIGRKSQVHVRASARDRRAETEKRKPRLQEAVDRAHREYPNLHYSGSGGLAALVGKDFGLKERRVRSLTVNPQRRK